MAAKSKSELMAATRANRVRSGLKRLELWAKPEHHAKIKNYAAGLAAGENKMFRCNDATAQDSSTARVIEANSPREAAEKYAAAGGIWKYSPVTVDVDGDEIEVSLANRG